MHMRIPITHSARGIGAIINSELITARLFSVLIFFVRESCFYAMRDA